MLTILLIILLILLLGGGGGYYAHGATSRLAWAGPERREDLVSRGGKLGFLVSRGAGLLGSARTAAESRSLR
jgi:hypothetical protein